MAPRFTWQTARRLGSLALAAVVVLGLALRLHDLHGLTTTKEHRGDASPDTAASNAPRQEDALLFQRLFEQGVLTQEPGTSLLRLPPTDEALYLRSLLIRKSDPDPALKQRLSVVQTALYDLYRTPPGTIVRRQVNLWNAAHRIVAIRDNRPRPSGETQNEWRALSTRFQGMRLRTGDLVPDTFGYVTGGSLVPGFTDWLTAQTDEDTVTFQSDLVLDAPREVTVQVVGRRLERVSPTPARITPRCRQTREATCRLSDADAFALTFRLGSGRHDLTLTVSVTTTGERQIAGLNIFMPGDNVFGWKEDGLPPPVPRSNRFAVHTADGTRLIDEHGQPSEFAVLNGLLPLVGHGPASVYTLSGLLAASSLPAGENSIRLTIEDGFQERAQHVLTSSLARFWADDPYSNQRKASLLILDADTGTILAAAGHPQPPLGVHPWDLLAVARVYPTSNPMSVKSWQGIDRHNAPGSTFKPLVGLAAVQAAKSRPELIPILQGLDEKQLRTRNNLLGFTLDSASYAPVPDQHQPIRNFGGTTPQPLAYSFDRNTLRSPCQSPFSGTRTLGLREATRDSVNIWFARLAVLMDGEALDAQGTFLFRTAQMLGFGAGAHDLAANLPARVVLRRWAFRPGVLRRGVWSGGLEGDVLYAQTGRMDLTHAHDLGLEMTWGLAQSSIGQAMETSPLQMALLASALATGSVVRPVIFQEWNGRSLRPQRTEKLEPRPRDYALLTQGLKLVTETGTAREAFANHPDQCRVFGKTGTANVGQARGRTQRQHHSAWFMGWREPDERGKRRLAFACMVSHVHGQRATGGSVCAPIVAELLRGS